MKVTTFVTTALAVQKINACHNTVVAVNTNMLWWMGELAVITLTTAAKEITTDLNKKKQNIYIRENAIAGYVTGLDV